MSEPDERAASAMANSSDPDLQQPAEQDDIRTRDHEALLQAAQLGSEGSLRFLLEQEYIEPNFQDHDGRTALTHAVVQGHLEIVKKLLEHDKVDPSMVDNDGRTALTHAAERGYLEIVKKLLEHDKVDPNMVDNDGRTALFRAVENWDIDVVKLLIAHDVDLNRRDNDEWSPLQFVFNYKRAWKMSRSKKMPSRVYSMAEILLSCPKVDVNSRDKNGRTVISHVAENGNHFYLALLLTHQRVHRDSADHAGRTPLSYAAGKGYSQAAKLLLEQQNVDPDSKDTNGRTPLLWAVINSTANSMWLVVELLLSHSGVDPHCRNEQGRTPLSLAVEHSNHRVVDLLIHGSSPIINLKDNRGRTALAIAAIRGNTEIMTLILQVDGIDLNYKDHDGRTPLSQAVEHGWGGVVELLLRQNGIDVNSKDKNGRTPLWWGVKAGNNKVIRTLLADGNIDPDCKDNDRRTPLSQAAEHGCEKKVGLLLQEIGIDINSKDYYDHTPLWWATKAGNYAVIRALLGNENIDPEPIDKDGYTPLAHAVSGDIPHREKIVDIFILKDRVTLHLLAEKGYLGSLRSLLESKIDINIKDIRGRTPLHTAILSGEVKIAEELMLRKADVDCKDHNGITPLLLALQYRQTNLVKLLLKYAADTRGLMAEEWFNEYNFKRLPGALELLQESCGSKSARFVSKKLDQLPAETPLGRQLLLFTDYSTWSTWLSVDPKNFSKLDRKRFFFDLHNYPDRVSLFLFGSSPKAHQGANKQLSPVSCWNKYGIAWTMIPPSKLKDGSCWKSISYSGMLPYGWIPKDGTDFFTLFVGKIKEDWILLCTAGEERMSQRRLEQLCAKGNGVELIQRLAEDAHEWATLRGVLRDQVRGLESFVVMYCREYDQYNSLETMQAAVAQLASEVSTQIGQLDQTMKELLQFEFAWVSINEAHKSTSIATSIKRLSWITFIFLPAMFASSLFGMNVDILRSNPDWRWYLLFGGGLLALTVFVWLLFKYGQMEQLIERNLGDRFRRWSNGSATRANHMRNDHSTLPT